MAKLTIGFGVVLILLSAVAYTQLGQHSHGIHSLIPGAVRAAAGNLRRAGEYARGEEADAVHAHRGDGGAARVPWDDPGDHRCDPKWRRVALCARPEAAKVQAIMGTICLIYVLLCVRSFIEARRARRIRGVISLVAGSRGHLLAGMPHASGVESKLYMSTSAKLGWIDGMPSGDKPLRGAGRATVAELSAKRPKPPLKKVMPEVWKLVKPRIWG